MMQDSFQNEIPKARVNIALNVEKGGALERKELPLKLLALGDFSQGKTTESIISRERINIHKDNLNNVLKELSPEINIVVDNKINLKGSELGINLCFKEFKDFNPQHVAVQIPELKLLLGMRNLLKDLKGNLTDNVKFRKNLEQILSDQSSLIDLKKELSQLISHDTAQEI